MSQVSFSLIWNVLASVSESGATAPNVESPLSPDVHCTFDPMQLRPSMGWPPAMPYVAFAGPDA